MSVLVGRAKVTWLKCHVIGPGFVLWWGAVLTLCTFICRTTEWQWLKYTAQEHSPMHMAQYTVNFARLIYCGMQRWAYIFIQLHYQPDHSKPTQLLTTSVHLPTATWTAVSLKICQESNQWKQHAMNEIHIQTQQWRLAVSKARSNCNFYWTLLANWWVTVFVHNYRPNHNIALIIWLLLLRAGIDRYASVCTQCNGTMG